MAAPAAAPATGSEHVFEISQIKVYVPITLDMTNLNYDTWRELFETHCLTFGVLSHLDGSSLPSLPPTPHGRNVTASSRCGSLEPSQTLSSTPSSPKTVPHEIFGSLWTISSAITKKHGPFNTIPSFAPSLHVL
uniref:Uncharacterized protein n=1 Tax=Noccaea caerulescens TaxID=107243 RepID=A0A1J3GL97_NOCCA